MPAERGRVPLLPHGNSMKIRHEICTSSLVVFFKREETHMIRNNSLSVIAAAVFAALSTAAVAQTTSRQSTDASQASQTNPTQIVNPSAATGVESNVGVSGSGNNVRMNSNATT